jgi:hypothetical protein
MVVLLAQNPICLHPPSPDEPAGDEEPAANSEPSLANSDSTSQIDLGIERVTHTGDDITTLLLRVLNRTTQAINASGWR